MAIFCSNSSVSATCSGLFEKSSRYIAGLKVLFETDIDVEPEIPSNNSDADILAMLQSTIQNSQIKPNDNPETEPETEPRTESETGPETELLGATPWVQAVGQVPGKDISLHIPCHQVFIFMPYLGNILGKDKDFRGNFGLIWRIGGGVFF